MLSVILLAALVFETAQVTKAAPVSAPDIWIVVPDIAIAIALSLTVS